MAIELVTGHAGSAHVSSYDIGAFNAAIVGTDTYILGDAPTLTLTDANTLAISACDIIANGRYIRLTGTNTVTIESGTQAALRTDIVYIRYSLASDGTESVALGVKTGTASTSGTATAPDLDYPGTILDGAQNVDIELARVALDGLTPTASLSLSSIVSLTTLDSDKASETDLESLRDSVSQKQPVVLYNGGAALNYDTPPGSGTTGTVTLSESAANFKELTIWGKYLENVTSVTMTNPDGRDTALQLFIPEGGPANMVYIKSSALKVSGTRITNKGWVAMWLSASTNHFDAPSKPEISIIRVEGRR